MVPIPFLAGFHVSPHLTRSPSPGHRPLKVEIAG